MAPNAPAVVLGATLLAGLAAFAGGCDNAPKREALALSAAVDQYRRADNAAKGDQSQAVLAVACSDTSVCAAKEACLAAISPTVRALTLKDEVTTRVADLEAHRLPPEPSDAKDLPAKLDAAERLLNEGHAKMEGCDQGLANLRTRFGL